MSIFWELFFETKFPGHIVARESHFFDQLLETRGGRGALKGREGRPWQPNLSNYSARFSFREGSSRTAVEQKGNNHKKLLSPVQSIFVGCILPVRMSDLAEISNQF